MKLFGEMTVLDTVLVGCHRRGGAGCPACALRTPGMRAEERTLGRHALETLAMHYLLVLRRAGALDTLEVRVETRPEVAAAGAPAMAVVAAAVRRRLREAIGLTADVTVVPPRTLERGAGKARRVEDLRRGGATP